MHQRRNPYTCIEEVRRSRSEVWVLVLVTVILGLLLGLLAEGLTSVLRAALPASTWIAAMAR